MEKKNFSDSGSSHYQKCAEFRVFPERPDFVFQEFSQELTVVLRFAASPGGSLLADVSGWESACGRVRVGVCLRTRPGGSLPPDAAGWESASGRARAGVCLRTRVRLRAVFIVWPVENGFQTSFCFHLHCFSMQKHFDETV